MLQLVECQHTPSCHRAVAIGTLLGDDPKIVLRVEVHLVVGITREGNIRQNGVKGIVHRIIAQHLAGHEQEDLAATVFGDVLRKEGAVGDVHMGEGIHPVVDCHAVLGHHPQSALLVTMQVAHLVVGQAIGLVIAEILMHLVAI